MVIILFIIIITFRKRKLNHKNSTPLHMTIGSYNPSKEIVELLITKGADINAKDIIYQILILLFLIIKI